MVKTLFWNREQCRLRAFWRLLIQGLLFVIGIVALALAVGVAALVWLLVQPGGASRLGSDPAVLAAMLAAQPAIRALSAAGTLGVTLASVWLAGRFLDRRRFAAFGFHLGRAWWLDLGFGLALGALLMVGIFLVECTQGWVTLTGTLQAPASGQPFLLAIAMGLVAYIAVGIYEELLSRGYQLLNLAEGLNLRPLGPRGGLLLAWFLSSAIFGLLHASNPNATAASTASLVLAGLFLGLGYVLSGELAVPIGLHITWNFFQGNVFGFAVSGTDAGASFIAIAQGGPDLWTGGLFGPEAGLLGVGAILVGSLLILLWVRCRQGRIRLCLRLTEPPTTGAIAAPGDGSPGPKGG